MAKRTRIYVEQRTGRLGFRAWVVTCGGKAICTMLWPRQSDAIAEARGLARQRAPSELYVRLRNGTLRAEATYGADPRRFKG